MMVVVTVLLISCSFCNGSSLSVVFLLLVPLFLLCFYLLLASSLHLSGGRLHPPALSVGCLSLLVGRLCLWAVEVYRSSSSVGCVYLTVDEPSLGRFWTVSWQSSVHVLAHAHFLGHVKAVIQSPVGHVSFRSALCSVVTWPTISSPVVPQSSLCRVTISRPCLGCTLSRASRSCSQALVLVVLSTTLPGCALGHAS